jgi:hypothetical protein
MTTEINEKTHIRLSIGTCWFILVGALSFFLTIMGSTYHITTLIKDVQNENEKAHSDNTEQHKEISKTLRKIEDKAWTVDMMRDYAMMTNTNLSLSERKQLISDIHALYKSSNPDVF